MRKELEDKLFEEFPLLYDKYQSIKKSLMCFGFECQDGWFDLIYDLSKRLYPLVQKQYESFHPDDFCCYATQVKEKYGSLRFYMAATSEDMDSLIKNAEESSETICEVCGNPGEIDYKKFWLECRCEAHK